MPVSTVRKILRIILQCYLFKITHVQELIPADLSKQENFNLQFLARMEGQYMAMGHFVDRRSSFRLQGSINTQNCRIWARENPFEMQPLALHSQQVNV
ncbi:hypothetical protein AVEN_164134-1 [Araneus ventricosus]|uniref:Uncharacterized protein n=1 Tax=Araneus ventricosus TaxID=182803 RepID=A0A4Y2R466_ARAVE|nr:hypothetical protein AVEN_164134-1 [Araneus ventricosus]